MADRGEPDRQATRRESRAGRLAYDGHRVRGWQRISLLGVALALTGLAATTAKAASDPVPSPTGNPTGNPTGSASGSPTAGPVTSTVVVLIDTLTPVAPRPTDTLRLAGRLLNTGDATVANISLQLRFGPVLSRFDLHRLRVAPETPAGFAGSAQPGPPALLPHATSTFAVDVPVSKLPYLSADGVHALRIEVHGSVGAATDIEVGDGDTFVPMFATPPHAPTRIAWVIPVVAAPVLAADGALVDAALPLDLAANGRLSRILAAAAPPSAAPVTWAVDPMTVQIADHVSRAPYQVHTSNGLRTVPADPAAARWLSRLRTLLTSGNLLTLPYADVDLVGLAANNQLSDAVDAFALGRETLASLLRFRGATTDAWPADGVLSQPAADFLAGHGFTSVLLSDAALPPTLNLPYTPTAIGDLPAGGRTLTAYVADGGLSALVSAGSAAAATPRMAEQLFLAETAMITSQRPSAGQDLVVLPPRNWDPGTSYGRAVLADSSHVPWLKAVGLGVLTRDPRDFGARQPLTFPPALSADASGAAAAAPSPDPLPADLLDSVSATRSALRDLATVFLPPATPAGSKTAAALTAPVEAALFGAESAAWRTDVASGYTLAQDAEVATERLRGKVRATAARVLTLTSASSPIPVTLVNDLPVDVRVTLFIEAVNRAKLASTYRQAVSLPAGAKLRVNIPVHVESAGTFTVLVSVLTRSGKPLGIPQQFIIRSAAYGRVALILTMGALGLLVIAILLRAVRRLRNGPVPNDAT